MLWSLSFSANQAANFERKNLREFKAAQERAEKYTAQIWMTERNIGGVAVFLNRESLIDFIQGPLAILKRHRRLSSFEHVECELSNLDVFEKPVFVMSPPRAGSTLLTETLTQLHEIWTIGGESHHILEPIPSLNVSNRQFESNRLTASDLDDEIREMMLSAFVAGLRDCDGYLFTRTSEYPNGNKIRFLEKTPRHALRMPFFSALFPDAVFILLLRDPRQNVSSIMEAWRTNGFGQLKQLPDWKPGECWKPGEWKMLLPPGWQEVSGGSPAEVAAFQWSQTYKILVDDFKQIPKCRRFCITYDELVGNTKEELLRVLDICGLQADHQFLDYIDQGLPESQSTLTSPSPEKWRKNEAAMAKVMPGLERQWEHLLALHDEWRQT